MKLKSLLGVFLLFLSSTLLAQTYKVSGEAGQFGKEVKTILISANDPDARVNGHKFDSIWYAGGYSGEQQLKIIAVTQNMLKKGYKAKPHLSHFFGVLSQATIKGIPSAEVDNLLTTTEKSVNKYTGKDIINFLAGFESFFKNDALYFSNFNKLYANGGTFSIDFVDLAPLPQPASPKDNKDKKEEDPNYFSDWETPAAEEQTWSNDWGSWDNLEESGWNQEPAAPNQQQERYLLAETPIPEVEGPIIRFENVNLSIITTYDSATLKNTKGSFMPLTNTFVGEGGKFDWSNAGLNPDEVYVTLKKFFLRTNKPEVSAESVVLTYKDKLSKEVEGVFDYKSSRYNKPEDALYPRFKSYDSDIQVKNMWGPNLLYKGGFALQGQKIYSSSLNSGMASIELKDDQSNKTKFIIKSKKFNLQDSLIQADRSAIVIYHQKDSIYHPAVQSKYNTSSGFLTLLKDDGGFKYTPFVSSYFLMDINADIVQWDVKSDSLNISILSGKSQVPAIFESQEYYNQRRFEELKGIYDFHPLQMVIGYARKKGTGQFYVEDMAKDLKQKPQVIRGAIRHLMQNGYIEYDPYTDFVKVNRKGYHYVLSSNRRKDYDNLLIPSIEPAAPNATLNFKKQELKVRGIEKFYISRVKDVYIEPKDKSITLLGGRNFEFDGQMHAGNYLFIGEKMRFDYDSFLVDMPKIDSIKFDVDNFKDKKSIKKKRLDNQLVETSGRLLIDQPTNKSSSHNYPRYPVFNAFTGSTIYFDRKEVAEGNYSKNITFTIPPFEIDSVSSSDPAAISFYGKFSSGGIFPDFDEKITVLPDNSLGFTHIVPKKGYPLYGGQATLYDTIRMDSKGLYGKGMIDYLTSKLYSREFFFYEDSVKTDGYMANMELGKVGRAEFPKATVKSYTMQWYPSKDSMYVSNKKELFKVFDQDADFDGTLIVTSKGLFGKGKLLTKGAEVKSQEYDINQKDFLARHAEFKINSSNSSKPILAGNDVRITYDLAKGYAEISPEVEGVAAVEFPYAQYRTSIPKATWNFEKKTVTMTKPAEVDISKSYFYTTRKELDSLAFNAENAVYDIANLTLNVAGIPYIKVADAKITPDGNKVLILENARLQKLENATIVVDTLNGYHNLFDGNISIESRNKFMGSANYQLVNSVADTFSIKFNKFDLLETEGRKRKRLQTVSSGTVKEEDNIILSPGMIYRGTVTMYADKPALELKGFVKLNLKTIPNYNTWIKYNSTGDQKEIVFDFKTSVTEKEQPLTAGLHYDTKTGGIYSTFITDKRNATDQDLFLPAGMLSYNAQYNEYRIEELNKKQGKSYSGRIFAYNENNGDVRFEGPLTFIPPVKGTIGVKAAGLGKGSLQSNEVSLNAMMVLNFMIPAGAEVAMGEDLANIVQRTGLPQAVADKTRLMYKLAEIVGEQSARSWEEKYLASYTPLMNAGSEMQKTIAITDVNLKWSEENKAWYSNGKIGISNIGETDVNAMLDGFMEIKKSPEVGNIINIFLQAAPGVWYYFNFEGNRLFTFSSLDGYNSVIASKSKISKAKPGEYAFAISDVAEALTFVNRFRKAYYGIETPYQMNAPVSAPPTEDDPFGTTTEKPDTKKKEADDDGDGF